MTEAAAAANLHRFDADPADPSPHAPGLQLEQLGYTASDLEAIRHAISAPEGLVLVVGPAGCGRRTALRAMLRELDASSNLQRGNCCRCRGRRMLLRRICSPRAAQFAIQAAQAGHRVFSRMAIGRACAAVAELRRLGVTAAQMIDGLSLVIAQRLLAKLCPQCAVPDEEDAVRQALAAARNTWLGEQAGRPRRAAPHGCAACGHTGYSGRLLACEVLEIDARARGLLAVSADSLELERVLLADGSAIWDRGLRLVAGGATSLAALQAAIRNPR